MMRPQSDVEPVTVLFLTNICEELAAKTSAPNATMPHIFLTAPQILPSSLKVKERWEKPERLTEFLDLPSLMKESTENP